MRQVLMAVAATLALGSAAVLADAKPAQAQSTQAAKPQVAKPQVARPQATKPLMALQNGDLQTSYSQWRDRNGWYGRPGYVARPYYGRGYYYGRPGYYRRDYGSAAAAGAIGLATGAIIGGAIAQSQAAPVYTSPNGAVAYCAQRFKSYDPASGTYLGYDGLRHACP